MAWENENGAMIKLLIFGALAISIPLDGLSQMIQANIDFDRPRLCMGDSVNLDASSSLNADHYGWEVFVNDTLLLEVDTQKLVYTPLVAGVYKVVLEVSNVQKDTDRDTAIFEVESIPKVGAGTYDSLCKSNLHFTELNKGFPKGSTGQWYYVGLDKNIDSSLWKQHSGIFKAGNYGEGRHYLVYKFRVPNTQCAGLDTTSIRIHPQPKPYATHSWKYLRGANRVCETDSPQKLMGNVMENGDSYTNYRWVGNGVQKRADAYYFVPKVREAAYSLTYTATNHFGCIGEYSESVLVEKSPTVDFTYRVKGTEVFFTNTSENARRYLWKFHDLDSTERVDASFDFKAAGTYNVTLLSKDFEKELGACKDTFVGKQVHIWPLSTDENNLRFATYPNPFKTELHFDIPLSEGSTEIRVYDTHGKLVHQKQELSVRSTINLERLPVGIYFLEVLSQDGFYQKMIVKE